MGKTAKTRIVGRPNLVINNYNRTKVRKDVLPSSRIKDSTWEKRINYFSQYCMSEKFSIRKRTLEKMRVGSRYLYLSFTINTRRIASRIPRTKLKAIFRRTPTFQFYGAHKGKNPFHMELFFLKAANFLRHFLPANKRNRN